MKTLLILGAGSGIARAVAHRYAADGWSIQLAGREIDRFTPDVSDIQIRYNVEVKALEFDALAYESHEGFVKNLSPLPDAVVCAFGVLSDQQEAEQNWKTAQQTLDVNFTGSASILHHLANAMADRKSGTIIGISSVAGDRGRASNYYYGSSKAGFTALLSGMRGRLKPHGVHVLTVKPGFVRTAMTEDLDLPEKLTVDPEKIAKDIFKAAKKKRATLYTPWFWRWIMLIIKWLPEGIFQKMKN